MEKKKKAVELQYLKTKRKKKKRKERQKVVSPVQGFMAVRFMARRGL